MKNSKRSRRKNPATQKQSLLDKIIEAHDDIAWLKADGFDAAIIGCDPLAERLVYSIKKSIGVLMEDMSEEDAVEHFEYNVRGSYVGEQTPIWVEDRY
jgi:hypothetical protein